MNDLTRSVIQRSISVLILLAIFGCCLFGSAGTIHWTRAWVYLGLSVAVFAVRLLIILPRNPDVLIARARNEPGTKPFDRIVSLVFGIAVLAMFAAAGLECVRWGQPAFGDIVAGVGLVLILLGDIPVTWTMLTNPYLETTVRIQEEQGHEVVTTGPYAIVRHPMYVGVIVQYLGIPLFFGSSWALPLWVVVSGALVVRTAMEDRTLREELPGYRTYTEQTRYRLLPGVW